MFKSSTIFISYDIAFCLLDHTIGSPIGKFLDPPLAITSLEMGHFFSKSFHCIIVPKTLNF